MNLKPFASGTLLLLVLLLSCTQKNITPPSEIESAKTELLNVLKNEGATFLPKLEALEDENAVVTLLKSTGEPDTLTAPAEKLKSGILLGVFRVKNKKNNQTDTYKSVWTQGDTAAYLSIVHLAKKTEEKIVFPFATNLVIPPPPPPPPPPTCDMQCCFENFNNNVLPQYQDLANKLCKNLYPGVICCTGNDCISVHYIVRPTRLKCLITARIDDLVMVAFRTLPRTVVTPPQKQ